MITQQTALICGVSGQDGSLLANFLLKKGYKVVGTSRDALGQSFDNHVRLGIAGQIDTISMNPKDFRSVLNALEYSEADEVYLLSGQSSVGLSFQEPAETIESILLSTLNMLDACRLSGIKIRQYYAGSIECFGDAGGVAITEETPFNPISPYGVAKSSAGWLVKSYRDAYGVYGCTGILSNHESALRPARFVTQKVIQGAKRIANGSKEHIELGRLDICRDWGWAAEFVEAMWLTLQQPIADDYIISTGQTDSLQDFVSEAFGYFDLNWQDFVIRNEQFFRPTDILNSYTNPSKSLRVLEWSAKTNMKGVVRRMIEGDLS